jgi:hypothetical protein
MLQGIGVAAAKKWSWFSMSGFKDEWEELHPRDINETDFTAVFCRNCQFRRVFKDVRPCCECFVKPSKFVPKVEEV